MSNNEEIKDIVKDLKDYAETHNLTIDELLLLIKEKLGGR